MKEKLYNPDQFQTQIDSIEKKYNAYLHLKQNSKPAVV
jgi:hypothetical protein